MYIVDKNKIQDVYDWVAKVNGIDTLITWERDVKPNSRVIVPAEKNRRSVYTNLLEIYVGDTLYTFIIDSNGLLYTTIEDYLISDEIKNISEWKKDYIINYGILKNYKHIKNKNNLTGNPITYRVHGNYYYKDHKTVFNKVLLKDTPLTYLDHYDVWDKVYNYLLRLKTEEENKRNSKITDKEKIINKGFDTKKSFRNMPR